VERDRSYYRRREVIEAAALVRCVLDANDHLALLTLLRSAAVGVPDAALIPLWSRELPRRVTELYGYDESQQAELADLVTEVAGTLPGDIPGLEALRGWDANLIAALEGLAALRESIDRDPPDVFVEGLRSLFLVEAGEAARYLGAFRTANLDRFFRELQEALAKGGSCDALLRRLRSDVSGGREAEEERPKAAVQDAVHVMTIHKAKGLDFEHVYLVQLHKGPGDRGRRGPEVVQTARDLEYQIFEAPTLGMAAAAKHREAVEAAERTRTLYVGLTRAKRRVVLMGKWSESPAPKAAEKCKSHIELLHSRRDRPDDLVAWMKEVDASATSPWRDGADARWRLPALGLIDSGADAYAPEDLAAPVTSYRRASEDAATLVRLRVGAQHRMARPWRAAASKLSRTAQCEELADRRFGDAGAGIANDALAPQGRGGGGFSVAAAAGTAIHRILEGFDLSQPWEVELARQRERVPGLVAPLVPAPVRAEVEERALELLQRLADGSLLGRLYELADRVLARELPLLIPPSDSGQREESGPVGFAAGSIDLLYRDPQSDQLVVVDYKTDRVEGEAELAARVEEHRAQGAVYVQAIRAALDLPQPPRFELWFVWADRVVAPD
jgi:ATP-dependent helicase/nuclease subunit A